MLRFQYLITAILAIVTKISLSTAQSVFPGDGAFKYIGCYNETTLSSGSSGSRALASGIMESIVTLTPLGCLSYCGSYTYAGLEYGKECWCAQYLNSLSAKLSDSMCDLPCAGNTSLVCGGSLRLSVYSKGTNNGGAGSNTAAGTTTSGTTNFRASSPFALALGIGALSVVLL